MEITKKEVEELIGDKVLTYKVVKSYRGYKVTKVRVVAIKAKDSKEVTITLKPNKQFRFTGIHIFICMIRTVKHKTGEYFIVNTFFEVKENGKVIKVPMFIQIDSTMLDEESHQLVYKAEHGLFNRTVALNLDKPAKDEKPWWKQLFKK